MEYKHLKRKCRANFSSIDKLSDNYEREINSIDDYKIVGQKYCKVNNIDMKDKWDFGKEELQ